MEVGKLRQYAGLHSLHSTCGILQITHLPR
jgi:hypothetical protein